MVSISRFNELSTKTAINDGGQVLIPCKCMLLLPPGGGVYLSLLFEFVTCFDQ